MQELTDTMLSQDMGDAGVIAIFFILIVLVITLVILIFIYTSKKKASKEKKDENIEKEFKGYGYIISIVIIIGIVIAIILNIRNVYESGLNSNWYLTEDEVIDKYKDVDYNSSGRTKTYYYVEVEDGEKVHITKSEYEKLSEGDEVYVLRYEDGSAYDVYSTKEYQYNGERLKE